MPTKHKVVSLKELLERSYKQDTLKIAEERVQIYLSTFRCRKNPDVEYFITNKSIEFQKKNRSRTYLILSGRDELMGYFSLATKPIIINRSRLSNKERKRANIKTTSNGDAVVISSYLIGQIGRSDIFKSKDINLEEFLGLIFSKIALAKEIIGGSNILIEVDNQEKLVRKYKEYGFKYLQEDESGLTQLWKLTLDY